MYTFQDGSIYQGDIVDSVLHGNGRMTWPDESVYEGNWVNGEMQGTGKFVSGKGEFVEGDFQRNFCNYRGVCTDIIQDIIQKYETEALLHSDDVDPIEIPVIFCLPDAMNLQETMETVLTRDNLIPFVVFDATEAGDPMAYAGDNYLHIGHAALCRRRHQDYKKLFHDGIKKALEEYQDRSTFCVCYSNASPGEEPLPDPWALDNFFDPFSFPSEIFDPKIFRGRPHIQQRFTGKENFGNLCRFAIIGDTLLREVTLEKNFIRHGIYERYGNHVPLHRCAIIVCTSLN